MRRLSPTVLRCAGYALLMSLAACASLSTPAPHGPTPTGVAAQTPPQDPASLAAAAETAYATQRWADSERLYTELVTREPAHPEAWFKLGNIYARSARPDFAVRAYREAVTRDPHHARALHNLGMVQLREAATSFEQLKNIGAADDPLVAHGSALSAGLQHLLQGHSVRDAAR